jgi:hypothetical protein
MISGRREAQPVKAALPESPRAAAQAALREEEALPPLEAGLTETAVAASPQEAVLSEPKPSLAAAPESALPQ